MINSFRPSIKLALEASVAPRCIGVAFSFRSSASHRLENARHGGNKRAEASRVAAVPLCGMAHGFPTAVAVGHNLSALTGLRQNKKRAPGGATEIIATGSDSVAR